MPPGLLFLKITLAIQGLLWFHTNFWIIFLFLWKNAIRILLGIMLNLWF